ncbi:MAG TPA: AAA family ATPase [Bryobacteraceae bacterium]|nr:AAA family ATPase [Bryobacteraceae bacterium]
MYNSHFGLSECPFSLSPDPAFYFRSAQHEEVLANLTYGVEARKGFIVLTGEVGTGKTTMLECLRDFLTARQIAFASLFNSRLSVDQFFQMLAYDLELACDRNSKTEVLFALNNFLLQRAEQGRTTALILDEAHCLAGDVLEEVRLLSNMETRRGKLLQIVLAGQTELDRRLEDPELRQLKQRIVLRCRLEAFSAEETAQYIAARLSKAGMPDQTVFPSEILAAIHQRSQGIPRLINSICDNLLLTCFAQSSNVATAEMLEEVSRDMRLEWPDGHRTLATAHPAY